MTDPTPSTPASSNPLTDALTPEARKLAYAAVFVASLVFAAWQAAHGDWGQFAGGLLSALVNALAASNVRTASTPGRHAPR